MKYPKKYICLTLEYGVWRKHIREISELFGEPYIVRGQGEVIVGSRFRWVGQVLRKNREPKTK